MQIANPLRPYADDIDAFARSLKLWVLELALWVVALTGSREGRIELRKWLAQTRREIRELICLRVVQRLLVRVSERKCAKVSESDRKSAFTTIGCTRKRRHVRHIRFLARGVRLRTLRDMQRVLAHIDRIVMHILKRMPRSFATHMLIAVAPPASACCAVGPAPAPDAADTS